MDIPKPHKEEVEKYLIKGQIYKIMFYMTYFLIFQPIVLHHLTCSYFICLKSKEIRYCEFLTKVN